MNTPTIEIYDTAGRSIPRATAMPAMDKVLDEYGMPRQQAITLAQAIRMFHTARHGSVSPQTTRIDRQYLKQFESYFGGTRELTMITIDDLRLWRSSLVERTEKYGGGSKRPRILGKLSVYTIHGMTRNVKFFYKWLYDEDRIKANIADRLQLPILPDPEPKAISEEDAAKILELAKFKSPRDYACLIFLYATGCRLHGMTGLRLSLLDLDNGRATVREKGKGGNNKTRTVFLSPDAVAGMRAWLVDREKLMPQHDYFFTTLPNDAGLGGGDPLSRHTVDAFLRRLAKHAGVTEHFNAHAWRHAFARRLTLKGAPLTIVSKLMGHSGTDITSRYYIRFVTYELQEQYQRYAV